MILIFHLILLAWVLTIVNYYRTLTREERYESQIDYYKNRCEMLEDYIKFEVK